MGLRKTQALAAHLERTHPDAAASLWEGLSEMFTVARLGVDATVRRTVTCTNIVESTISICRTTNRNVKHWRDEATCAAAGAQLACSKANGGSAPFAAASRRHTSSLRSAARPTLSGY